MKLELNRPYIVVECLVTDKSGDTYWKRITDPAVIYFTNMWIDDQGTWVEIRNESGETGLQKAYWFERYIKQGTIRSATAAEIIRSRICSKSKKP